MAELLRPIEIGADDESVRGRLARETARMAGRLAALLEGLGSDAEDVLRDARAFLTAMSDAAPWSPRRADGDPIDRLAERLGLTALEVDLVILAGMPDEHEGYASVFRRIHPAGLPEPTVGLAAQLLAPTAEGRALLRALLESGTAVRRGVIERASGIPFPERSLRLADGLWSALHGLAAWPDPFTLADPPPDLAGLDDWLNEPMPARAARAVGRGLEATVLVSGEPEAATHDRGGALARHAGVCAATLRAEGPLDARAQRLLAIHCAASNAVPVLRVDLPDQPAGATAPALAGHPGPAVVCVRTGVGAGEGLRPVLAVPVEPLGAAAHRAMWRSALPSLTAAADGLGRRYRVEPGLAAAAAADVRAAELVEGRPARTEDVTESLRARTAMGATATLMHVRPQATFDDLVLPPDRLRQLREAIDRLANQRTVIDAWGFLPRRRGSRGVRMLFAGPPGTGKTLSAEVMARALGVDLLVADLSKIVSKWLGETERNLSVAFDAAERAHSVLLFDEADALFGKRTEISDAHDRYANLETAYLLARLDRFEGLAILSTNLRRNIDAAFTRRLEFVVSFEEPGQAERERIWRAHLPAEAPMGEDLDPAALAARYPVVGGLIRNAAVAAAFLAAAEDEPIHASHVDRAMHREYEKAGRAFPGPMPRDRSRGDIDGHHR